MNNLFSLDNTKTEFSMGSSLELTEGLGRAVPRQPVIAYTPCIMPVCII